MRPDLIHTAISAELCTTGLKTSFHPLIVQDPLSALHGLNITNAWVGSLHTIAHDSSLLVLW